MITVPPRAARLLGALALATASAAALFSLTAPLAALPAGSRVRVELLVANPDVDPAANPAVQAPRIPRDMSHNRDVGNIRGEGELRAIFGQNNRLSSSATARMGEDTDKTSAQFDLTYPAEFLTGHSAVYLQLPCWTGYGESPLDYDLRSDAVRAGFPPAR